jgi:hypothetical protein
MQWTMKVKQICLFQKILRLSQLRFRWGAGVYMLPGVTICHLQVLDLHTDSFDVHFVRPVESNTTNLLTESSSKFRNLHIRWVDNL